MRALEQVESNIIAMAKMEALWNEGMDTQTMPDTKTLDQALADPTASMPRKMMLQELKDFAQLMEAGVVNQSSAPVAALKVSELSGDDQELILTLTRRGLSRSGLGQFGQSMLEGLLVDHPKLVLKKVEDPQHPTKMQLKTLLRQLMDVDEKMDALFLQLLGPLNEQYLGQVQGDSNPMSTVRAANQARMIATEQVMEAIGETLASSNPLP